MAHTRVFFFAPPLASNSYDTCSPKQRLLLSPLALPLPLPRLVVVLLLIDDQNLPQDGEALCVQPALVPQHLRQLAQQAVGAPGLGRRGW